MTDTTTVLDTALARARDLPPMTGFPSIDDLLTRVRRLAEDASIEGRVIGHSRLGEPIECFTVGRGTRHVVVAGGVHPNEPIGFHTVLALLRLLTSEGEFTEPLDLTWHIVPCIDPDGARLNESWFADPSDRVAYFRGFYRPAPDEQVEWSFPFEYAGATFDRPMPETRALMRLFDEVRPDVFMGLHNAEIGGVYYYVGDDDPVIVDALAAIPAALGLPLDVGEPEGPELQQIRPAVFRALLARESYDYLSSLGLDIPDPIGGGGSADYLERYGTYSLVAELPYWSHPDAADTRPSGRPYREVVAQKADALFALHTDMTEVLDAAAAHLTLDTPFLRSARAFAPAFGRIAESERARLEDPDTDREATVAEVFGNEQSAISLRLRFAGCLRRALAAEVAAGTAAPPLRRLHDEFEQRYERWCQRDANAPGLTPIPVERLVGVQLAALLTVVLARAGRAQ